MEDLQNGKGTVLFDGTLFSYANRFLFYFKKRKLTFRRDLSSRAGHLFQRKVIWFPLQEIHKRNGELFSELKDYDVVKQSFKEGFGKRMDS